LSKLRCHISISLDGCVAGPNQSEENPLGDGGERLHKWVFGLAAWRELHGKLGRWLGARLRNLMVSTSVATSRPHRATAQGVSERRLTVSSRVAASMTANPAIGRPEPTSDIVALAQDGRRAACVRSRRRGARREDKTLHRRGLHRARFGPDRCRDPGAIHLLGRVRATARTALPLADLFSGRC
jgi:hypothetical protein